MIKVIAFDFAKVIVEGPMSKWIRENSYNDLEKLKAYREKAHKWDLGEMPIGEMYKHLGQLTGIAPESIWEQFYEKALPNTEVINLIKKLKKNYKIILFSNFVGEILRKLLNKHEITDLFDEIIVSSEHRLKKPDPEFFNVLLKKSGVNKNEILFIDDNIKNIKGAKDFGINQLQFTSAKKLFKDLKDYQIF